MDNSKLKMDNKKFIITHMLAIKRYRTQCLSIVESVLNDSAIDENKFLNDCQIICKSDYNDMINERSIIDLCGYPLCTNHMKQCAKQYKPSQKYHVSVKYNKVFDITERKLFCSDLCFKSSNHLRQQIHEQPIWLRDSSTKNIEFCLYDESQSDCENRHESVGEEVILNDTTCDNNVDQTRGEPVVESENAEKKLKTVDKTSAGFPYIKVEDLEALKTQMSELTVSERVDLSDQSDDE